MFEFTLSATFTLTDSAKAELADVISPCLLLSAWGIVDRCKSWTKYAPVVLSPDGRAVPDFANTRTFWDDEVQQTW